MKIAKFNPAFQYEIEVKQDRWVVVHYDTYVWFKGAKRARLQRA